MTLHFYHHDGRKEGSKGKHRKNHSRVGGRKSPWMDHTEGTKTNQQTAGLGSGREEEGGGRFEHTVTITPKPVTP